MQAPSSSLLPVFRVWCILAILSLLGHANAGLARSSTQDGTGVVSARTQEARARAAQAQQAAQTPQAQDGTGIVRAQAQVPPTQDGKSDAKSDSKDTKNAPNASDNKENSSGKENFKSDRSGTTGSGKDQEGAASGNGAPDAIIEADKGEQNGDIFTYDGYVNATMGDQRLQADHVTYNRVTGDMVAEGNVIFDQGSDQRVAAKRAEINSASHRGTFWEATGFTNRTETGEFLFFTAERVEKTGPETYELYSATVTACEDVIPKWSFTSQHAQLKVDYRVLLHGSVFRVRGLPAFFLPISWLPVTKKGRKAGFLIPSIGNSNQKGRQLKAAYFQPLGDSADITFRGDIYSQRGIGLGAEFRAQTDDKSYVRLGIFSVKDRLFGTAGENQGGTGLVADGVQYLPHGWLAVANVSLVSSLAFRQVFSDDISQVINPTQESTVFANNNTGNFSFNFLASNEINTLFVPGTDPSTGTNIDIHIRQLPQIDFSGYSRRIFKDLPIYVSFDSSLGSLKREEVVNGVSVLQTPGSVQRLDFQPKITIPLATFGGFAVTPSLSLRETYYSASINPKIQPFDPNKFATDPTDPRLDPTNPAFVPGLQLFDPVAMNRILPTGVSRRYAEFDLEIRPPSVEKDYLKGDGSKRFRHVIEPYITYRRIAGIGDEFARIIRFDERDAVANTNEFEYAVLNRFFVTRSVSEISGRRRRQYYRPPMMEPERPAMPLNPQAAKPGASDAQSDSETMGPEAEGKPKTESGEEAQKPEAGAPGQSPKTDTESGTRPRRVLRDTLETGEQAELRKPNAAEKQKPQDQTATDAQGGTTGQKLADGQSATQVVPPTLEAYEFLTIKVAQKYFFDRNFGGALVDGQRNVFYPIDTLSGFTYGGHARSFSPLNLSVHYRPLSTVYADLRMDIGSDGVGGVVRNVMVSGGVRRYKFTIDTSWYLSRRIELQPNSFEPGTFSGNQVFSGVRIGDEYHGVYGGARIGYDFTDRFITATQVTKRGLTNTRNYIGFAWDCCGLQFNYNTFKAGLRNESAFTFTFTLAGLGSFGTDQFSQLGGGRGGRKRGKKLQNDDSDYGDDGDYPDYQP
ncbi:MAG TPA: LPS assembly protein LptD [Blastocatellia bacterium]|nr:LPS assembly protein LptD [Blastocatellia bacterium]